MTKDSRFTAHLKWAASIVAGWPAWKRNILGRTIMPEANSDFNLSDKAEAELTKGHNKDNYSKQDEPLDVDFEDVPQRLNPVPSTEEALVISWDEMMVRFQTVALLNELTLRADEAQGRKLKQLVQLYTDEQLQASRK